MAAVDLIGLIDTRGILTTLDVPGSISTDPEGIDDEGVIVGNYTDAPSQHGAGSRTGHDGQPVTWDPPFVPLEQKGAISIS